jgi:hypothetical protein
VLLIIAGSRRAWQLEVVSGGPPAFPPRRPVCLIASAALRAQQAAAGCASWPIDANVRSPDAPPDSRKPAGESGMGWLHGGLAGRTAVDPVLFLKDKIFEKKGSETWTEKHSSPCWR